ncbi:MAG: YajQ family cyclic di-GMP-binding protein [Sumerlaeia bacterium]
MPTVDIVNKIDLQLVDNAINSVKRTIETRYDFRGVETEIELNKKDKTLKIVVPDNMKLKAVKEIITSCLIDQKVSPKIIKYGDEEDASLGAIRLQCKIQEGIEQEIAKKVVKLIKDSGLKVKPSIQGDQVRVEGKKIDDLQEVMQLIREADFEVPLQFDNMKR